MPSKPPSIDDFKTGDKVVPKNGREHLMDVVNVNIELRVIICRRPGEKAVHGYLPDELEKVGHDGVGKKGDAKEKQQD